MIDTTREPSPSYFISFAFACTGIACAGIGLWAAVAGVVGANPLDGVNDGGSISTVLGFATMFSERATRWERLRPEVRRSILAVIIGVLAGSFLATLVCLFLAVARLGLPDIAMIFGVAAAVCQISAAYWLLKLRT
ncbi:hypothetical protein [Lichenicola sp.]|uniref:hypothetical protein n=1 Tax=Lichenicola sp. TaxID=2804529 RepID=UPI003B000AB7